MSSKIRQALKGQINEFKYIVRINNKNRKDEIDEDKEGIKESIKDIVL